MNRKKTERVWALPAHDRLSYFIRKVTDFEELWGCFEDGWVVLGSEKNKQTVPFWPEREFAETYIENNKLSAEPKKIELNIFLERWIPGMEKDGAQIAVFPTILEESIILDPLSLKKLIEDEAGQYDD